jgi:hypothetical protein
MTRAIVIQAKGIQLRVTTARTAPLTIDVNIDVPIRKERGYNDATISLRTASGTFDALIKAFSRLLISCLIVAGRF